MCVKEFLGYNCGHCSVPVLRQCPLSASNSVFPLCKWPAERPIFTNEFCHPCSRVVWNAKVLKDEEEHRARHLAGECQCEVIFEGEDREKRLRSRPRKGGNKGKGKDVVHKEHEGYNIGEGDTGRHGLGIEDAGEYAGHMVEGDPGGYGGHALAAVEPGGYRGDRFVIEERFGLGNAVTTIEEHTSYTDNMVMTVEQHTDLDNVMDNRITNIEEPSSCQEWEPQAQNTSYEYCGYYIGTGQNQGSHCTNPSQSYVMTLDSYQQGQLPMGQVGAGMKWYPQDAYAQLRAAEHYDNVTREVSIVPRATSEPIGKYDRPGLTAECPPVLSQPTVVSSDMMSS